MSKARARKVRVRASMVEASKMRGRASKAKASMVNKGKQGEVKG